MPRKAKRKRAKSRCTVAKVRCTCYKGHGRIKVSKGSCRRGRRRRG